MIAYLIKPIQEWIITPLQWLLQKIFPPDTYHILICPQSARYLSANTLHFAHYLKNHSSPYTMSILSKSKKALEDLNKDFQGQVYYTYSWSGIRQFLKAKTVCVSHGPGDFFPYVALTQKLFIHLWHGTPIKKIGNYLSEQAIPTHVKQFTKKLVLFLVASEFEKNIFMVAFDLSHHQVKVIGLPKNDVLSTATAKNKTFKVLYAPTFRDCGKVNLFPFKDFDAKILNTLLLEYNIEIMIRQHIKEVGNTNKTIWSKSIYEVNAPEYNDPQKLLMEADLLITDYSGIYFDYMLTDRPTAFIPYDLEEYSRQRGFLFDYHDHINGPVIQSQTALIQLILDIIHGKDAFVTKRKDLKKKFHAYNDGQACNRLLKAITILIDDEERKNSLPVLLES